MNVAVEGQKLVRLAAWLCVAAFCWSGCAQESVEIAALSADYDVFQRDVYPILLRDCGFPQCHGSEQRFYQVFGPGRVRIAAPPPGEGYEDNDVRFPVDALEIRVTYERTRSMLTRTSEQEDFLLLRKALEVGAGGSGHKGTDRLGRNVYKSRTDPAWLTLKTWADAAMTGTQ